MKLKGTDLNKTLKKHLHTVENRKVLLHRDEGSRNAKLVKDVLTRLVKAMRDEDDLFDILYQRDISTGSFYEGLRVKSATEFDLNLVFRLPFNYQDVEIRWCTDDPAYVEFRLHNDPETCLKARQKNKPPYDKIMKKGFFDAAYFLKQDKVTQWIQSIISKVMNGRFQLPPEVYSMKHSRSGPAFTYYLQTEWGQIDVDLVPVIDSSPYDLPEGLNPGARFHTLGLTYELKTNWFLVPKPFKAKVEAGNTEPGRYWRMAFPEAEKKLVKSTEPGCFTKLIKLFKLLRDCNEYWRHPLPSYFIKTFFLWEYEKKSKEEWHVDNLGYLFLEMLKNLQTAVETRCIPYYFNRKGNLLKWMTPDASRIIGGRIGHFLNKIDLDADYILEMFELQAKGGTTSTTGLLDNSQMVYIPALAQTGKRVAVAAPPEESSWRCVIL